ncbi:hypothetical protein GcC1_024029 [Golovinomyces cichoracearum]|uniref:Glycosyltransferase 2 n=1 Tax=Golovinomyces cichoracearum TaxID=62708 RepID=A0A420J485_9PEZI|nr:hypothetical protein GcC1_024029 [Golovinomyces cichoracearum]
MAINCNDFSQRLYARDEELGKKYDDHRPGQKLRYRHQKLNPRLHAFQWRGMKRLAFALFLLIALYNLFKYTQTGFQTLRIGINNRLRTATNVLHKEASTILTKNAWNVSVDPSAHLFDGPIKFLHLSSTLRSSNDAQSSKNVLFAAASLKSAGTIIPEACEMANWKRNNVHFAIFGHEDMPMDILKSINGVGEECKITFHDARPDYSTSSSDARIKKSVSSAFEKIQKSLNLKVLLVNVSEAEESWFLKMIKSAASDTETTLIELPENSEENLRWIFSLDSKSLSAWNKISVEVVIHLQQSGTGSLVRLLESLKKADYFSSRPPHLTIELPHTIEEETALYLRNFKYPAMDELKQDSFSTLHHRIPQHNLTPEENSIRMMESFWPADPSNSHVLILSPQGDVSPMFFHYLKYSILEYKYGSRNSHYQDSLFGISLDFPSSYLNGTVPFVPPQLNQVDFWPFLWQAPNSNACLYFSEKWIELHDFISRSLKSQQDLLAPPVTKNEDVSKKFPSWLEYFYQLARLRGYHILYPNFGNNLSLVIIHNDLNRLPEEYNQDHEIENDPPSHTEYPLLTDSLSSFQSHRMLPNFDEFPILSWDGEEQDMTQVKKQTADYINIFSKKIGGCTSQDTIKTTVFSIGDLFCPKDLNSNSIIEKG